MNETGIALSVFDKFKRGTFWKFYSADGDIIYHWLLEDVWFKPVYPFIFVKSLAIKQDKQDSKLRVCVGDLVLQDGFNAMEIASVNELDLTIINDIYMGLKSLKIETNFMST